MENNTYLKIILSFVNGIGVANSMFKNFVIYTTLATVAFVLVGFYGMNRHPELINYIGYYELIFLAPKYSVPFGFMCSIVASVWLSVRGNVSLALTSNDNIFLGKVNGWKPAHTFHYGSKVDSEATDLVQCLKEMRRFGFCVAYQLNEEHFDDHVNNLSSTIPGEFTYEDRQRLADYLRECAVKKNKDSAE